MYQISNRHRDDAISFLRLFAAAKTQGESHALANARRRAGLLAGALEKKKPMEEVK